MILDNSAYEISRRYKARLLFRRRVRFWLPYFLSLALVAAGIFLEVAGR